MDLTEKQINNFWNKVIKQEGCWSWSGCTRHGYGIIHIRNKTKSTNMLAHRITYSLKYGIIPEGLFVLHKCDNPICCNPDHLFLGTHQDNMRDMVNKGRSNGFNKNRNRQKEAILLAKTPEAIEKKKNTYIKIQHQQKEKNSQYGTMWIYNLELKINKKIKKDDIIPEGWLKGRKINFNL